MSIDNVKKEYEEKIAELNNKILELEEEKLKLKRQNSILNDTKDMLYSKIMRLEDTAEAVSKLITIYKYDDLIIPDIPFTRKYNNATISSEKVDDVLPSDQLILMQDIKKLNIRSLSRNAFSCLLRTRALTVKDLLEIYKTKEDLLSIPNIEEESVVLSIVLRKFFLFQ